MEWTRTETLALASQECSHCLGLGLRDMPRKGRVPCVCVFRSIFRICHERFRQCVNKEKRHTKATLEYSPRGGRRITWGRKDEEFIADFLLVCRRNLTEDEYKVFNYYHLLGAARQLCCRRLGIDKNTFFAILYRIERHLGRVFCELQPYALYPLDEYFNGRTENQVRPEPPPPGCARVIPIGSGRALAARLKVPLREAA